jgi:hypothetical protein
MRYIASNLLKPIFRATPIGMWMKIHSAAPISGVLKERRCRRRGGSAGHQILFPRIPVARLCRSPVERRVISGERRFAGAILRRFAAAEKQSDLLPGIGAAIRPIKNGIAGDGGQCRFGF